MYDRVYIVKKELLKQEEALRRKESDKPRTDQP